MEASVLDLRYKMRDILRALNKREKVTILYHGKKKAELIPLKSKSNLKTSQHPIFGMINRENDDPAKIVAELRRKSRHAF